MQSLDISFYTAPYSSTEAVKVYSSEVFARFKNVGTVGDLPKEESVKGIQSHLVEVRASPSRLSNQLQLVSNQYADRVSNFQFSGENPLTNTTYDFPFRNGVLERVVSDKLTREEGDLIQNKRLVIMGDSIDAFILGKMGGCKREKNHFLKTPGCGIHGRDGGNIDAYVRIMLEKYNSDIIVHRAGYGVDPGTQFHVPGLKVVNVYKPNSQFFNFSTNYERYMFIFRKAFEHLPEGYKIDFLLLSMNVWVLQREIIEKNVRPNEYVKESIRAFAKASIGFFNPKVVAFHTTPIPFHKGKTGISRVAELNTMMREICKEENYSLFDWERMTEPLPRNTRLMRDQLHPSSALQKRLAEINYDWMLHVSQEMNKIEGR